MSDMKNKILLSVGPEKDLVWATCDPQMHPQVRDHLINQVLYRVNDLVRIQVYRQVDNQVHQQTEAS